jgi:hypothetical protein
MNDLVFGLSKRPRSPPSDLDGLINAPLEATVTQGAERALLI